MISKRYLLVELPGAGYRQRTKANVRDSDATLIITVSAILSGGSLETAKFAGSLRKPWLHLHQAMDWQEVLDNWVGLHQISTLNVAGPRSSKEPAVGAFVPIVLDELIRILCQH